jgi:hypothetical protein
VYGNYAHLLLSPLKIHVLPLVEGRKEDGRVKMMRKKFRSQVGVRVWEEGVQFALSHLHGFRCVDADTKNLHSFCHWESCEIRDVRTLKWKKQGKR